MRPPPRARDVEKLHELAIQLQATQNSEAHGGEVGVSIGGEPRQGVKGNVREDTRGTERAPDAADPS